MSYDNEAPELVKEETDRTTIKGELPCGFSWTDSFTKTSWKSECEYPIMDEDDGVKVVAGADF
jgi:hypothetical protein